MSALQTVLSARLREGCTGLIRGSRSRWYELTLTCGCVVERRAKYCQRVEKFPRERILSEVLSPPRRAFCESVEHQLARCRKLDATV